MALRFPVATDTIPAAIAVAAERNCAPADDGRIAVAVDARSVATYRRIHDGRSLAADEALLRYRMRDRHVNFATNAFSSKNGPASVMCVPVPASSGLHLTGSCC